MGKIGNQNIQKVDDTRVHSSKSENLDQAHNRLSGPKAEHDSPKAGHSKPTSHDKSEIGDSSKHEDLDPDVTKAFEEALGNQGSEDAKSATQSKGFDFRRLRESIKAADETKEAKKADKIRKDFEATKTAADNFLKKAQVLTNDLGVGVHRQKDGSVIEVKVDPKTGETTVTENTKRSPIDATRKPGAAATTTSSAHAVTRVTTFNPNNPGDVSVSNTGIAPDGSGGTFTRTGNTINDDRVFPLNKHDGPHDPHMTFVVLADGSIEQTRRGANRNYVSVAPPLN